MDPEVFMDALEESSDLKITDRKAFMSAFRGLVNCCGEEESDDGEEEDQGKGKGLPSVALILGKKR
jgi:hypothetical protein